MRARPTSWSPPLPFPALPFSVVSSPGLPVSSATTLPIIRPSAPGRHAEALAFADPAGCFRSRRPERLARPRGLDAPEVDHGRDPPVGCSGALGRMCLGNGEVHSQRVAAEGPCKAGLDHSRNWTTGGRLASSLFPAAPLFPPRSTSLPEGVFLPAPVFPIRQALKSILAAGPVLAGCRATGIWVTVRAGHVAKAEAIGPTSAVGLIGLDQLFTDTTGPTPPGCTLLRPAGGISQLFDLCGAHLPIYPLRGPKSPGEPRVEPKNGT